HKAPVMFQTEDDLLHREPSFSSVPFCVILALIERQSTESGVSTMTFDEILAQIIDLLQRQGRVSYPALKIRFGLDDDYLEALKAEIIEAQQLAADENGRVLVWTGAPASAAAPPLAPGTPARAAAPSTAHARDALAYTPKHLADKILTSRSALEG